MFPDCPRSITGRIAATPSLAARRGEAPGDFKFSGAFERYSGRNHRVRLRGAQHWWRSRRMTTALCAHPDVGRDMVQALLPWLHGLEGDQRAAARAGISVPQLHTWRATCTRVAKELMTHGHTANAQGVAPGPA